MKRISPYIIGILAGLLVTVSFAIGTVFASPAAATGCFPDTNGHWAETFICWLKDNGIAGGYPDGTYQPSNNVTRAEMAVMMQKLADVPPSQGQILVTMGQSGWSLISSSGDATLARGYVNTTVFKPTAGDEIPVIGHPDMPLSLYGRSLAISGVEICYTADLSADAYITLIEAYVDTQSSSASSTFVKLFRDDTDRKNKGCPYFTFTSVTLSAGSIVTVGVFGHWDGSGSFALGRATFVLTPTTTTSVSPLQGLGFPNGADDPDSGRQP